VRTNNFNEVRQLGSVVGHKGEDLIQPTELQELQADLNIQIRETAR